MSVSVYTPQSLRAFDAFFKRGKYKVYVQENISREVYEIIHF